MDRVETHVEQGRDFTENAKKELYQANVYASKARKVRMKFLFLHPSSSSLLHGRSASRSK